DCMMGLEIAMIAAMGAEMRDGSALHRWYILHEFGKQAMAMRVAPFLVERFAERRHGLESYFLETQQLSWLPRELIALFTGIIHGKGTSPADFKLVQETAYAFRNLSYHQIMALTKGEMYCGFKNCND